LPLPGLNSGASEALLLHGNNELNQVKAHQQRADTIFYIYNHILHFITHVLRRIIFHK
jgi:hypothetical protein